MTSMKVCVFYILGISADVVITSSKIANISSEDNIFLNFVLADGRVFANLLVHCGSLLSGEVTVPSINFEYQLEGFDTEGNKFKTNAGTKSTINIGKHSIHLLIYVC